VVRNLPHGRTSRARLSLVVAVTASLLTAAVTSPSPSAASDDHSDLHRHSDLHHHRNQLERSVEGQTRDVDEVSRRLIVAEARLESAVRDLSDARAALAGIRARVRRAARTDSRMQERLTVAIGRLADAQADLAQSTNAVQGNRAALAAYAVSNYQSGGSLSLDVAFESASPQEALDSMQAVGTVLDKQSVALQQVQATRVLLKLTAQRVEQATEAVAEQRGAAATTLQAKRELEAQAETAKQKVATRVAHLRDMRRDMAAAKRVEIRRLKTLQRERDRVEERLREIAEQRARRHARELAQHRQHAAASAVRSRAADDGFLSDPVHNTYVTSPYGMRMHPVLHVRKLHDGTDFHAGCGTPVYAAASGRVMSEYYNVGYGNRLLLDHGFVRGVSLSSSYNHLTSFAAGVGEQVDRGELIAYSGTTGYSTACHLHFMVYVNGYTVDPARWL
jgi:murein DD-endopeptidase MepM/ murein hydrolase activator NlpD